MFLNFFKQFSFITLAVVLKYLIRKEISHMEEKKLKSYRCTLCGFIYKGEELPDDYVCPICGASKDMFEEVNDE